MKKEVVHFISLMGYLTPCGLSTRFSPLQVSNKLDIVTCKLCLNTHWFKDEFELEKKRKDRKDRIEHINKFLETNSLYLPKTKNLD